MGKPNTVFETEPGHPRFSPAEAFKRLKSAIDMHNRPGGLISYWNQEKNRNRRKLMTEQQQGELEKLFQTKLEALNDAGPY